MATTQENILTLLAAGYSQTRIAGMTGIPQPRLSRWAAGEVPRAADDAVKLASLVADISRNQSMPAIGSQAIEGDPVIAAGGNAPCAQVEA